MFYFIYGKDTFRSREKLRELLDFFKKKEKSLDIFRFDEESLGLAQCQEMLKGQTLFGEKRLIVCDRVFGNKDVCSFLTEEIERFSFAPNIFIFWEEEVGAEVVNLFKKHAKEAHKFELLKGVKLKQWFDNQKISSFEKEKITKKCGADLWCASKEIEKSLLGQGSEREMKSSAREEVFNIFHLCDAVARKDRKGVWVLFNNALLLGVPVEEIFYKVLWQIKNLLLVKVLSRKEKINIAKETGLHPYVIKKTLAAVNNFTEEDLSDYSFRLIKIFHDSRRGLVDLSLSLESFLIGI